MALQTASATSDEDETQLDALRDIEHHEDVEHLDDDEPAFADPTVRQVLATHGARFLAVVAACTIVDLIASNGVIWQRLEDVEVEGQPTLLPAAVERQLPRSGDGSPGGSRRRSREISTRPAPP